MEFGPQVRKLLEVVEEREPQQPDHYSSPSDEDQHLASQTT